MLQLLMSCGWRRQASMQTWPGRTQIAPSMLLLQRLQRMAVAARGCSKAMTWPRGGLLFPVLHSDNLLRHSQTQAHLSCCAANA